MIGLTFHQHCNRIFDLLVGGRRHSQKHGKRITWHWDQFILVIYLVKSEQKPSREPAACPHSPRTARLRRCDRSITTEII
eukprot:2516601-Amphidinium_carterae.3